MSGAVRDIGLHYLVPAYHGGVVTVSREVLGRIDHHETHETWLICSILVINLIIAD